MHSVSVYKGRARPKYLIHLKSAKFDALINYKQVSKNVFTDGFNGCFGIGARLLPIERSRPDVFHQGCGIARSMLKYLQDLLDKISPSVRE